MLVAIYFLLFSCCWETRGLHSKELTWKTLRNCHVLHRASCCYEMVKRKVALSVGVTQPCVIQGLKVKRSEDSLQEQWCCAFFFFYNLHFFFLSLSLSLLFLIISDLEVYVIKYQLLGPKCKYSCTCASCATVLENVKTIGWDKGNLSKKQ